MGSYKSETKNSPAILKRIAQADKSAVSECIDLYGKMIWALAKQHTRSAADAEQAVSEIFMDIWRDAAFCDTEMSDESIWIALIARRRLSEYAANEYEEPTVLANRYVRLPNPAIAVQ